MSEKIWTILLVVLVLCFLLQPAEAVERSISGEYAADAEEFEAKSLYFAMLARDLARHYIEAGEHEKASLLYATLLDLDRLERSDAVAAEIALELIRHYSANNQPAEAIRIWLSMIELADSEHARAVKGEARKLLKENGIEEAPGVFPF